MIQIKNFTTFINEKAEGDTSKIDNPDIEKALKKKSDESDIPIKYLRIVMRRGMDAWNDSHRKGVTQEAWGYARVNAFINKKDTVWGKGTPPKEGSDSDVAREI